MTKIRDTKVAKGNLSEQLSAYCGPEGENRILVIGVGRRIRGDESAGLMVADELAKMNPRNYRVLVAEDRPENYTDEIRHYNQTHILYLLATRSGGTPGETRLITIEEHERTSLHESPLTTLTHYLSTLLQTKTRLLLIEPKTMMGEASRGMETAAKRIAGEIAESMP